MLYPEPFGTEISIFLSESLKYCFVVHPELNCSSNHLIALEIDTEKQHGIVLIALVVWPVVDIDDHIVQVGGATLLVGGGVQLGLAPRETGSLRRHGLIAAATIMTA